MSYTDEKIIKLRNEYKEQMEQEKTKGNQTSNELINFKEYSFFDNQFQILLPDYLKPLDQKSLEIKYPSQNRPPIVLSDASNSINFTFNLIQQPLNNEYVGKATHVIKQLIKRVNPGNVFYKEELLQNDRLVMGYFDYKSYAIDDDVYNIAYTLPINNQTMLGTFNCKYSEYQIWRSFVLEVIKTSEDLSLEEGDERV